MAILMPVEKCLQAYYARTGLRVVELDKITRVRKTSVLSRCGLREQVKTNRIR